MTNLNPINIEVYVQQHFTSGVIVAAIRGEHPFGSEIIFNIYSDMFSYRSTKSRKNLYKAHKYGTAKGYFLSKEFHQWLLNRYPNYELIFEPEEVELKFQWDLVRCIS